jgi:hypothetical protein
MKRWSTFVVLLSLGLRIEAQIHFDDVKASVASRSQLASFTGENGSESARISYFPQHGGTAFGLTSRSLGPGPKGETRTAIHAIFYSLFCRVSLLAHG